MLRAVPALPCGQSELVSTQSLFLWAACMPCQLPCEVACIAAAAVADAQACSCRSSAWFLHALTICTPGLVMLRLSHALQLTCLPHLWRCLLQALRTLVQTKDPATLAAAMPAWIYIYNRLVMDNSR